MADWTDAYLDKPDPNSKSSGDWTRDYLDEPLFKRPQAAPPVASKPQEDKPVPSLLGVGARNLAGSSALGVARLAHMANAPETAKYFQDISNEQYEIASRRPMADFDKDPLKTIYEAGVSSFPAMGATGAGMLAGAKLGAPLGPWGATVGGLLGGTAAGVLSYLGENAKEQMDEKKVPLEQTDILPAGGAAGFQSAIDVGALELLLGNRVKLPAAIANNIFKRVMAKAAMNAGAEGLGEGTQELLQILQANPDKIKELDPESIDRVRKAALIGGALGGVFGAVSGIPSREQPSTPKGDKTPPPVAPTEEPPAPPAPPAVPPEEDYEGYFDEPPPTPPPPPSWAIHNYEHAPGDDPRMVPYNMPPHPNDMYGPFPEDDSDVVGPGEPPVGWDPNIVPPPPGSPPGERASARDLNVEPQPPGPAYGPRAPEWVPNKTGMPDYRMPEPEWLPNGTGMPISPNIPSRYNSELVFKDVKQKLLDAGVPEIEANANAAVYRQVYMVMSQRTGIDPLDLYKAANMQVEGPANFKGPKQPGPKTALMNRVFELEAGGLSRRDAITKAADELGQNFMAFEQGANTLNQDQSQTKARHYQLLESVVNRAPWKEATGQQWKNFFQKNGVKAEEMEWSSIGSFLDSDLNGKFTKNDLLGEQRDMTPTVEMLTGDAAPYRNMTLGGMGSDPQHNYRVMLLSLPKLGENYVGGHWSRDVKNVVAHTRLTDATTPDGKTVTIGNEFQSDPHQAARGKGYRKSADEIRMLNAKEMDSAERLSDAVRDIEDERGVPFSTENRNWLNVLADPSTETMETEFINTIKEVVSSRFGEPIAKMADEHRKLAFESQRAGKGVTNMPFKETWPNLLFRQGLMDAINNNKDYFAWPTGEQEVVIQGHQGSERHEKAHKLFMDKRLVDYATKLGKAYGVKPEKITVTQGGKSGSFVFDKNGQTITVRDPQTRHFIGEYNLRDSEDYWDFVDSYGDDALLFIRSRESGNHFYAPSQTVNGMDLQEWQAEAEKARDLNQQMLDKYGIGYDTLLTDVDSILASRGIPKAQWAAIKRNLNTITELHTSAEMAIDELNRKAKGNVKEHQVWALPITPAMRELVKAGGFPLYQLKPNDKGTQTPRANISWLTDKNLIRLFKSHDASSFMHESMHLWLEQMVKMAPYSSEIAYDVNDLRRFVGNTGGPFTGDQHEKIARAWEKYLMKGKAPTSALADVFKKFAQWLKDIYGRVMKMDPDAVPDYIHKVFDRMLTEVPTLHERPTPTDIVVRPAVDNRNMKTTMAQNNRDPLPGRRIMPDETNTLDQSAMGDEQNYPRNSRIAQNPIRKGLGWFQRVFNPFSQLEDADAYRDLRNLASGGVQAATEAAAKAKKALSGLTPAEQEAVNQYMETKNANPTMLPERVRTETVNLKKYINGPLKKALVDNKLISEEAANKYDDAYLPRLYLKYLVQGEGNVKGARMNRQYGKQRSNKTEDELLALGEIKDPAIRSFFGIFRPMRDLAMMDFLNKIANTQGKNWIIPESLVEWNGHKVTPHWLKQEAEAIRTVRSKAEPNPDRVKDMLDVARRMEETAVAGLDALGQADYNPTQYKTIPDTREFGPMRGMVVRKEIADDITGAVNFVQPDNWFDKFFGDRQSVATKAISLWKMVKVPLNPPSQVRNVISNMMLLNLSGVRVDRVVPLMVAAAKDMRANGKYTQIAKKYGVGVGTFSEQELYAITDELNRLEMQSGNGLAGWKMIYRAALKAGKKIGDVYQMMEVWGKVAKIKHAMEREGMDEAGAVREANKWLFDYSEVPQAVRRARQSPIGYPFMTFTYKVIPLMAEVVSKHPTRMLPWIAMAYMAPAMVAALNDIDPEDPEKLRRSLPPALRKYNDMYLLPFKDDAGRWQFVNVGYFMPWQMPWDVLRNIGAAGEASLSGDQREALNQLMEAGAATNILSNPLFNIVTAITTGIDPFSDKPIMDKRDPPREQIMDLMSYIGGLMLPTMFSPFGALGMALDSQTTTGLNRYGEPGMTGGQIAARAAGLNVYPVIPEAQRARNIQQMQREIQDIRSRMTFSLRDQSLTPEQRRNLVADFQDTIKDRVAQLQKYVKESEPSPRLRAASTIH